MHAPEEEEGSEKIYDALLPVPITASPAQLCAIYLNLVSLSELELEPEPESEPLTSRIKTALQEDPATKAILDEWENQTQPDELSLEEGLLHHQGKIWVPDDLELKRDVLSSCHDAHSAGHFGIQKTFELVTRSFY